MIMTSIPASIPDLFQLFHGNGVVWHSADFFQHNGAYFLTIVAFSGSLYFQCLEQNILFGIHDGHSIFEASWGMVGSVHMNMLPAGRIHLCPMAPQTPHYFLQFAHLSIGKFGTDHFGTVFTSGTNHASTLPAFRIDTAIIHKLPLLPLTAFTPSDSLATASNSWILILTFPITSLRNLFPNFLRKKTGTYTMSVSVGSTIPFP